MCFGGSKKQAPAPAPQPVMARQPVEPEIPVGQAPTTVPEETNVMATTTTPRTTSNTTGLTIPK